MSRANCRRVSRSDATRRTAPARYYRSACATICELVQRFSLESACARCIQRATDRRARRPPGAWWRARCRPRQRVHVAVRTASMCRQLAPARDGIRHRVAGGENDLRIGAITASMPIAGASSLRSANMLTSAAQLDDLAHDLLAVHRVQRPLVDLQEHASARGRSRYCSRSCGYRARTASRPARQSRWCPPGGRSRAQLPPRLRDDAFRTRLRADSTRGCARSSGAGVPDSQTSTTSGRSASSRSRSTRNASPMRGISRAASG